MGKINLSSLKTCIESANRSFRKIEEEEPFEMHIVSSAKPDNLDSMVRNTQNMLQNLPSFSQTGS